jgi:hypothetical protein
MTKYKTEIQTPPQYLGKKSLIIHFYSHNFLLKPFQFILNNL